MAEPNWIRHAILIGRFEFRRSVRAIWQDKARFILMAAGLVIPSLILAGLIYLFSEQIRTVGTVSLPPIAEGTVALFWLFGVFIATQRVVSARPRIDAEALMLTSVSARSVVGGLLLAETLRALAYLGVPVVVVTIGVGYLFGSATSMVLIPLTGVLLGSTAVLVGMVLGYAIALLLAISPFVAKHKTVFGSVAVLLAMGGYLVVSLPQVGGVGQEALSVLPMGWFADLAVIGSPIQGSLERAALVVVGSLLVIIGGIAVVEREATRLWFTDPVQIEDGSDSTSDAAGHLGPDHIRSAMDSAIAPVRFPRSISLPTRRVAQWAVLRTRRDPRKLNFLILPVVLVGSAVMSSGADSTSPWEVVAPATAVVLPWMVGAIFGMNPFGDEGALLPVTMLSVSGPAYIQGLLLPGFVFGIPLVLLLTGIGAVLGPFGLLALLGLLCVGLLTTIVATTTAPAIGMVFPRYSAISIGQSREVIPPRLLPTVLHFVGTTIPALLLALLLIEPGLARAGLAGLLGFLPAALIQLLLGEGPAAFTALATWFQDLGTQIQSTDLSTFRLVTGVILVLGAGIITILSYRLAIRRFEQYSPPS